MLLNLQLFKKQVLSKKKARFFYYRLLRAYLAFFHALRKVLDYDLNLSLDLNIGNFVLILSISL